MPTHRLSTEGYVLKIDAAGESSQRCHFFSREKGLLDCRKRISARSPSKVFPELFDHAQLELEQPQSGKVWFVREYRVLHRFEALAKRYNSLLYASEYSNMLNRNLVYLESPRNTFHLFAESLQHWESSQRPEVTYFKSLYLFTRDEGYPVKEDWGANLLDPQRLKALSLLRHSLDDQEVSQKDAELLIGNLKGWIAQNTEIQLS